MKDIFKKEIIGDCTLYLGSCVDILPEIGRVSHVICDPPYEAQAHKKMRRTSKSLKTGEDVSLDFSAITEDLRDFISNWGTKNSDGWCIYFCQAEAVAAWRDSIEKFNGKYKRPCIWVKPDSTPQLNGAMPAMGYENFVCQWSGAGISKWNAGGKRGVYTHCTNQPDRTGLHPTEKPLPLMKEILKDFTNKGDMIADPFMGSGTTLVAAAKMHRQAIGIELDQKYFDVACRRVEEAYKQPDMFIEPPKKYKQESMI